MAGINSRGFEIPQRFDLGSFPKPRGKRQGPIPTPADAVLASGSRPFTRIWSTWIRHAGVGLRSIKVSPAMAGPAIITCISYFFTQLEQAGFAQGFQMGWSVTPATEQFKGPTTTTLPGQVIFEPDWSNDNAGSGLVPGFGTEVGARFSTEAPVELRPGYIINEPTFYLWLCFDSFSANATKLECNTVVLNQVSALALANYAG